MNEPHGLQHCIAQCPSVGVVSMHSNSHIRYESVRETVIATGPAK